MFFRGKGVPLLCLTFDISASGLHNKLTKGVGGQWKVSA